MVVTGGSNSTHLVEAVEAFPFHIHAINWRLEIVCLQARRIRTRRRTKLIVLVVLDEGPQPPVVRLQGGRWEVTGRRWEVGGGRREVGSRTWASGTSIKRATFFSADSSRGLRGVAPHLRSALTSTSCFVLCASFPFFVLLTQVVLSTSCVHFLLCTSYCALPTVALPTVHFLLVCPTIFGAQHQELAHRRTTGVDVSIRPVHHRP